VDNSNTTHEEESLEDSDSLKGKFTTKALIRTRSGDIETPFHIKNSKYSNPKSYIRILKQIQPVVSLFNFKFISCPELNHSLLQYENTISISNYKFGILYCRSGQRFEEEMYRNSCGSLDFEEFLSLLGDRITLKNHTGWNAGLDTISDQDGTHSIYTTLSTKHKEWTDIDYQIEIMFHVSTMLGFEGDMQQIMKKKHIGNDVVVIIFSECRKPFSPIYISSKFNQIFVLIKKSHKYSKISGKTVYNVDVTFRDEIDPFGPPLPTSHKFEYGAQFRDWLLLKCINGERSAYDSINFKISRESARHLLLEQIYQTYVK